MRDESRVPIHSDIDIVHARQKGREFAARIGFSSGELTLIATAISELARNIVEYAQHGEMIFQAIHLAGQEGICITAKDEGPGILDVGQALQDGYSSRRSYGLGLPGTKRIVDEFEIASEVGTGTTIVVRKWKK
ncbi:MAG: anti-sigma regulatory factor [Ignavibacteriales bacterium]|nr:anti-sigma regulatory factor [Ignavibacteriales bacterium]